MTTTIKYHDGLVQTLQFLALAPLSIALCCLLTVWKALSSLWAIRTPVALTASIAGCFLLSVIIPALPIGLGLIAVFGYITYPRG